MDPWGAEALTAPGPLFSISPSNENWRKVSRVDRPDACMCLVQGATGHPLDALCIHNPKVDDAYEWLEQELNWQIFRGLPFKDSGPSRRPDAQSDYVYYKLTDRTICSDVSKPGMGSVGDYGFQGSSDGTSYCGRFSAKSPPADAAIPVGGDSEGRWLVKTGTSEHRTRASRTPGQALHVGARTRSALQQSERVENFEAVAQQRAGLPGRSVSTCCPGKRPRCPPPPGSRRGAWTCGR